MKFNVLLPVWKCKEKFAEGGEPDEKLKFEDISVGDELYEPKYGKVIIDELYTDKFGQEIVKIKVPYEDGVKSYMFKYSHFSKTPVEKLKNVTDFFKTPVREEGVTLPSNDYSDKGTKFSDYVSQGASNRHLEARADDSKLTAGEAAKELSKMLNKKILAKDVQPLLTEWHHAGLFYNKFTKKMSGKKVYFAKREDLPKLAEQLK